MKKLFTNFNGAFGALFRRLWFQYDADNRRMLGTYRKRAKAMNTKNRNDTNGKETNENQAKITSLLSTKANGVPVRPSRLHVAQWMDLQTLQRHRESQCTHTCAPEGPRTESE
jgi:hypothetical protein